MDEELEALRCFSVDELAVARRRVIKQLNLLDWSVAGAAVTAAALERTMELVQQLQNDDRRRKH